MLLPLLRNFSSRFAAILVYAQLLSLPLCDVILILAVLQITEFPILQKQKSIFRHVPKLNTFFFMEIQQKYKKFNISYKLVILTL